MELILILVALSFIGLAFTGFISTCLWLHYACTRKQCIRCHEHLRKSFGFCPACGHSRHGPSVEKETRTETAKPTRRAGESTATTGALAVTPGLPETLLVAERQDHEKTSTLPPLKHSHTPSSSHTSLVAERQDHEKTSTPPPLKHSHTPSSSHTSLVAERQDHEKTSTPSSLKPSKTPSSSETSLVAERQDHEKTSTTPSLQHSATPPSTPTLKSSHTSAASSPVPRQAARGYSTNRNWPEILIRSLLYIGVLGMVATLLTLLYSQKELITNTKKFGLVMAFTAGVYLLGRTMYLKFKYERTGLAFIFLSFFFVPLNYYAAKAFMLVGSVGSGAKFEMRLPPELAEWGIVFGLCGIIYFIVSLRVKESLMPYVALLTASLGTVLLVWHYSPPWLGWGGAALTCAALLETWRRVSPRFQIPVLIPAIGAGVMGCFAYLRYLILLPESGLFTTGMYGMCMSVAVLALAHQLRWMEKNWVTPALFTFNLLLFLKHFSTGGLNYTGVFFLVAFVLWGIEKAWSEYTKISDASPLRFDGQEVSKLWRNTSLMVALFAAFFGMMSLLIHTFPGLDFPMFNRGAHWMVWGGLMAGALYFFMRRNFWPEGVLVSLLLAGGVVWHWSFLLGLGLHGQVISLLAYTALSGFTCRVFGEKQQGLVRGFAIVSHLSTLGLYLTVHLFLDSSIWPSFVALGSAAFLAFEVNRSDQIGLQAIGRLWLQVIAIFLTHVSLFFLGVFASVPRELIGLGELLLACVFQWAGRFGKGDWSLPFKCVSGVLIGTACVYHIVDGIYGDMVLAAMLATLITALNCAGVAWRNASGAEPKVGSTFFLQACAVTLTHAALAFTCEWAWIPEEVTAFCVLLLACGFQLLGSFRQTGEWALPIRWVSAIILGGLCSVHIVFLNTGGGPTAMTSSASFLTALCCFNAAWRDKKVRWIYLGGLLTCHSLLFGALMRAEDWALLGFLQMAAASIFQMAAWIIRSSNSDLRKSLEKAFERLSWLVMIPAGSCGIVSAFIWGGVPLLYTLGLAAAFYAGLCALTQKQRWGILAFAHFFFGIHVLLNWTPGVLFNRTGFVWTMMTLSGMTLIVWAWQGRNRLKHWFLGGFEVACWMNFLVLAVIVVDEREWLPLLICGIVIGLCAWLSESYRYKRTSFLVFSCGGTLLLSYIEGAFRFIGNLSVFASEPTALVGFMLLVPVIVFLMGVRYVVWAGEQENPPFRVSNIPLFILCLLTIVASFLMCVSSKTFVMFYCVGLACVSGAGFVMLNWQWMLYAGLFLLQPAFFLALDLAGVGNSAMRIWAMFMGATLIGVGHLNREHYDNKNNPFVQMGLIVCVLAFFAAFFMPGVFQVQSEALMQTIAATLLAAAVFAVTGWVQSQPALFTFAGLSGLMAYYLILLYFPVRQVVLYSIPPGLGLILWGAGQRLGRLKKGAVPDVSLIQIGMGILFVPSLFQMLFPNQPTAAIMTALAAKGLILLALRTRIRWMFYLSTGAIGLTFAIELHHLLRDVHIPHWAWLGIISMLCIFIGFLSERRFKLFMKESMDGAQSRLKDFFFEWR